MNNCSRLFVAVLLSFVFFLLACGSHEPARRETKTEPVLELTNRTQTGFDKKTARELGQILSKVHFRGQLTSYAEKLLMQLPVYETLFQEEFPRATQCRIDVILMVHSQMNDLLNPDPEVIESQRKVKDILEDLRPDVGGFEGSMQETVNFETLAEEIDNAGQRFGQKSDRVKADSLVQGFIEQDGLLMYLKAHPNTIIVGIEDEPLFVLQLTIVQWLYNNPGNDEETATVLITLSELMKELRSQVAVAKVLRRLRLISKDTGAVVIGASHGQSILDLCKQIGLRARFFQTAPDEYVRVNPETWLRP